MWKQWLKKSKNKKSNVKWKKGKIEIKQWHEMKLKDT